MRKKTDLAMAVDLAWAAGFLEGEGCIYASKRHYKDRPSPVYQVALQIINTDPRPLAELQRLFGGHIYSKKFDERFHRNKRVFRWQLCSHNAIQFLKSVIPYLRFKKEQAQLAIKLQKSMEAGSKTPWGWRVDVERLAYREDLYLQLKEVKKRGSKYSPKPKSKSPQLNFNLGGDQ